MSSESDQGRSAADPEMAQVPREDLETVVEFVGDDPALDHAPEDSPVPDAVATLRSHLRADESPRVDPGADRRLPDQSTIEDPDQEVSVDSDQLSQAIHHLERCEAKDEVDVTPHQLANYFRAQITRSDTAFPWGAADRLFVDHYQTDSSGEVFINNKFDHRFHYADTVTVVLQAREINGHRVSVLAVGSEDETFRDRYYPEIDWGHPKVVVGTAKLGVPLDGPAKAGDPAILRFPRPAGCLGSK